MKLVPSTIPAGTRPRSDGFGACGVDKAPARHGGLCSAKLLRAFPGSSPRSGLERRSGKQRAGALLLCGPVSVYSSSPSTRHLRLLVISVYSSSPSTRHLRLLVISVYSSSPSIRRLPRRLEDGSVAHWSQMTKRGLDM
uniref:Uncharacterized protein n=1 Tax=Molossus molossus TaxID=27622 RepID=A0A7J8C921_MOLMO|nr:hypothetical protein HJG59_009983 [Molossus molossus]